jgi:branched-subunit amino acid aminotransferase/4-amino-4-deoxychorismate lyase
VPTRSLHLGARVLVVSVVGLGARLTSERERWDEDDVAPGLALYTRCGERPDTEARRMTHIEIDGVPPAPDQLWATVSGYGHFTAMQVRTGKVRGLALHLRRLKAANREAFGVGLDGDRVRALVRHALGATRDASVRVYVFEAPAEPATMVTVKAPAAMATPQRLQSARYQRPDAHIKHVTTDQGYHRRRAQRSGFDDAVLVGPTGVVSETTLGNVGFFDGAAVVWPAAPMLHGITMQLLERELAGSGVPARRSTVRVQDIASLDGAFVCSARGIAAVTTVDRTSLPVEPQGLRVLAEAYASVPWDSL